MMLGDNEDYDGEEDLDRYWDENWNLEEIKIGIWIEIVKEIMRRIKI